MEEYETENTATSETPSENVLSVRDLRVQFFTFRGIVKAIDGVSFDIQKGEIFGLVGESGCGKSVTATSIMDLIPDPPGRIVNGSVFLNGYNIIADLPRLARIKVKSETNVRVKRYERAQKRHNHVLSRIRGSWVSMIFQEPSLSLNPVYTIGTQITRVILQHQKEQLVESIIKREKLTSSELVEAIESMMAMENTAERNSAVSKWCEHNGLKEIEETIKEIFIVEEDRETAAKKIARAINSMRFGKSLAPLIKINKIEVKDKKDFRAGLELFSPSEGTSGEKGSRSKGKKATSGHKGTSNNILFNLQMGTVYRKYAKLLRNEARTVARQLLERVNLSDPERVLESYPHELSGGMQQRVMIAMSLSSSPSLVIADEPTTALDVTTQAQILELLLEQKREKGTSMLFITHDLAVIAQMCDRVGVMYAGNLVEEAPVEKIFSDPKHPYTVGLLRSIPSPETEVDKNERFDSITGDVPDLINPPLGCRFNTRCPHRMDVCGESKPALVKIDERHRVACFLYSDQKAEEVAPNA